MKILSFESQRWESAYSFIIRSMAIEKYIKIKEKTGKVHEKLNFIIYTERTGIY